MWYESFEICFKLFSKLTRLRLVSMEYKFYRTKLLLFNLISWKFERTWIKKILFIGNRGYQFMQPSLNCRLDVLMFCFIVQRSQFPFPAKHKKVLRVISIYLGELSFDPQIYLTFRQKNHHSITNSFLHLYLFVNSRFYFGSTFRHSSHEE